MSINYAQEGSRIPIFTIGDRLRKAREDTDSTQGDFANELGITSRTIGRYESAKDARGLKRAIVLAYAMRTGVPVEWLETGMCTSPDSNREPTD